MPGEVASAGKGLPSRSAVLQDPPLAARDGALRAAADALEQVARRHDADEFALVHDRKAADAAAAEKVGGLPQRHLGRGRDAGDAMTSSTLSPRLEPEIPDRK